MLPSLSAIGDEETIRGLEAEAGGIRPFSATLDGHNLICYVSDTEELIGCIILGRLE